MDGAAVLSTAALGSGGRPAHEADPWGGGARLLTNEVVRVVDGVRHKRLGGSDVVVSELGLGTQRWCSTDYNAPDEALCHAMLDRAVLDGGVSLIDTAEGYPIPSDDARPEGTTEEVIGRWFARGGGRRARTVVSTKVSGGADLVGGRAAIVAACDASLRRLRTDHVDVYSLHWPARYTPQANWGQSLAYDHDAAALPWYEGAVSFEEVRGTGQKNETWGRLCD